MLHKISPYPSLPKRGSEGFPTGGNDRPERKFLMIASLSSGSLLIRKRFTFKKSILQIYLQIVFYSPYMIFPYYSKKILQQKPLKTYKGVFEKSGIRNNYRIKLYI
jgi:hypothetical protein